LGHRAGSVVVTKSMKATIATIERVFMLTLSPRGERSRSRRLQVLLYGLTAWQSRRKPLHSRTPRLTAFEALCYCPHRFDDGSSRPAVVESQGDVHVLLVVLRAG